MAYLADALALPDINGSSGFLLSNRLHLCKKGEYIQLNIQFFVKKCSHMDFFSRCVYLTIAKSS